MQLSYLLARIWYSAVFGETLALNNIYRVQAIVLFLCNLIVFSFSSPYKNILKRNKWQEVNETFRHTLDLAACNIIVNFFIHIGSDISRRTFLITWLFYFVLETGFRLFWKRTLRHHILVGRPNANSAMILVTTRVRAIRMLQNMKLERWSGITVRGIFLTDYEEENDKGRTIRGIPVLGNAKQSVDFTARNWVDEVLINVTENPKLEREIESHFQNMGITTHVVLKLFRQDLDSGTYVEKIGNYIVTTHNVRDVPLIQWAGKRALDIIGGIAGLILTGIIFIFVAPLIYHADKGPVLYKSTRIGKNGRLFQMYKFRSMYQDADARKAELMEQNKMQGLMFKVDNDPRILPGIGNFIRKTSLDEFPQFWNVLKGDMSLVGTRPPTLDEWNNYEEQHRIRMVMRPGITGLWQISGRSDITDFDEVVALDERYIETWTVGRDIKIILQTVGKIVKHEGAE